MTLKQDARLYGRAIKSRWNVSDDVKQTVIETLEDIALNGKKDAARVSACNALLAAEAQNQKDEHKVVDIGIAKRNAELDAIADDLGISPDLVADAIGPSSNGDQAIESSSTQT